MATVQQLDGHYPVRVGKLEESYLSLPWIFLVLGLSYDLLDGSPTMIPSYHFKFVGASCFDFGQIHLMFGSINIDQKQ